MAKSENPAEASSPARQPRPAARLHPDAGLHPDAFASGASSAGFAPAGGRYDDAVRAELHGGSVGLGALHEHLAGQHLSGPGLAKARRAALHPDLADTTRSSMFHDELDAELLGDDDVLDEAVVADEAFRAEAFPGVRFGVPRMGGAKVPLANLEPPSAERFELTPSPVPRVSLSPATGAVDISLVPGPGMPHSRNLPTLAAQHLMGRRQPRRPAPAVTLPPPGEESTEPLAVGELTLGVRSSKREVVLGLTIGLGLSMLLAVVGQAYLREDVVAEAQRTPGELESITLSARPEAEVRGAAPSAGAAAPADTAIAPPSEPQPAEPVAARAADAPAAAAASVMAKSAAPSAAPAGEFEPTRGNADGERAPVGSRSADERADGAKDRSERVLARATRQPRGLSARARRESSAAPPPSFESDKSLSEAARERTPMSPAESAGLGLDLQL